MQSAGHRFKQPSGSALIEARITHGSRSTKVAGSASGHGQQRNISTAITHAAWAPRGAAFELGTRVASGVDRGVLRAAA
jgi:hypothetical protein